MNAEEYREIKEREASLMYGDTVTVVWTNSGNYYRAVAGVLRVNLKSIAVALKESVDGYPFGYRLRVPRLGLGAGWSQNNRVYPKGEYTINQVAQWIDTRVIAEAIVRHIEEELEEEVTFEKCKEAWLRHIDNLY